MLPAFTSEHDVDIRPLLRAECLDQQRAVRANIDLPLLLKFLDGSYHDEPLVTANDAPMAASAGKGKKRALSDAAPSTKATKRAKVDAGKGPVKRGKAVKRVQNGLTASSAVPADDPMDVDIVSNSVPPATNPTIIDAQPNKTAPSDATQEVHTAPTHPPITNDTSTIQPVFSLDLQFELHLARGPAVEHFQASSKISKVAGPQGLAKEEDGLVRTVRTRLDGEGKDGIELGEVVLAPLSSSVGLSAIRRDGRTTKRLVRFHPPVPLGGEAAEYDFTSGSSPPTLLHAALQLVSIEHPRAALRCTLHLFSSTPRDGLKYLPISLRLLVRLSLLPNMFDYTPELSSTAEAQRLLLTHIFPPPAPPLDYDGTTSVPFFYSSLHAAPAPPDFPYDKYQPTRLEANLLPFQRRSVAWLLSREGVTISSSKEVIPLPSSSDLLFFTPAETPLAPGELFDFAHLTGALMRRNPEQALGTVGGIDGILGGMLSEEMGLGKTLECLGLILLNPAPDDRGPWNVREYRAQDLKVRQVKTTLIVCPASLIQQWADEIALHAPELDVLLYKGWKKEMSSVSDSRASSKGKGRAKSKAKAETPSIDGDDEEERKDALGLWATSVHEYDIVLTTFDDLRKEFHVSQPRPERPRRDTASYTTPEGAERARSPLVTVEWWRVIMDEVQLQGHGNTAAVVSLIPRRSSFAVSGTPVQNDIRELIQVLKFLRVPLLAYSPRLWSRMLTPGFASQFVELFQRIAIRTSKAQVVDELTIPPQRRYLVPIEMGPVERHLYNDLLEAAYNVLGVDSQGHAIGGEAREVDTAQLRTWLLRLRQSCTHPQIGQLQRGDRVLGGALRSITEVLELMRYQNRQLILNEKRDRLERRVKHALFIQLDETNMGRWKQALELLVALKDDVQAHVDEVKAILETQVSAARERRKAERDKAKVAKDSYLEPFGPSTSRVKGKGKAVAHDGTPLESDDEWLDDEEELDAGDGKVGGVRENRLKTSRVRIRECYVLQHKVFFALGDIYHKLGKAEEDEAYGEAEQVRRTVLKNTEEIANRAMEKLISDVAEKGVGERELEIAPSKQGGIRGGLLYDEANDIIDLLNEQRDLLWEWRGILFKRLTEKLSGDGDASGEEYAHALDAQGDAEAYLQAYAALLADRKETLLQERTALAAHDFREIKSRHTRAAIRAEGERPEAAVPLEPQHEVLARNLLLERKGLRERHSKRPLKTIVIELSSLADRSEREENYLLKAESRRLRNVITDQDALNVKLEAELSLFRQAFNGRILYFRQLQELSDSVMELNVAEFDGRSLQEKIDHELSEVRRFDDTIRTLQAKQRYLDHMEQGHDKERSSAQYAENRECVLCSSEFERGCLTACGHIYCEDCLNAWLKKPASKFCPVCRAPMTKQSVHRIVFQAGKQVDEGAEPLDSASARSPAKEVDYNLIDDDLLRDITEIEAHGQYGAKVQTLVKHLLWVKENEPDAKSIVFSAWVDSLNIITRALQENGISCIRVEAGRNAAREFRLDPGCRVLLLHGERENAGLNVTCASRVFLLEPVVNHAFEVQAIGRVDRMGQTRSTEVFCYYAIDTVEKGVLDLAARNGVSIYTKDQAGSALTMMSLGAEALSSPTRKGKKGKGDFMAKAEDMLAILFPQLYERSADVERPQYDPAIENEVFQAVRREEAAVAAERRRIASQAQPVAGPSRLG